MRNLPQKTRPKLIRRKINKDVSIKALKEELSLRSRDELLVLCLRLGRFKKENKELLAYLLFESSDERAYINRIKTEIDDQFGQINTTSIYFIKKSIRKILKDTRKHIRYSKRKETEVELLIYFCNKISRFNPPILNNTSMNKLYHRIIESIKKAMLSLHEDLQYDFGKELDELISPGTKSL